MARHPDVRYIQYYTEGSAAYKLEPVKKAEAALVRKPVKRKRKNIYIDPLAIGGIAVAVVMLVLMLVGMVELRAAQQQTARMEAQVETLKRENVSLEATFEAGYDLETIKWQAEALGLIPVEQAQHITVKAPETQQQTEPDAWERFYIFLTGLFA